MERKTKRKIGTDKQQKGKKMLLFLEDCFIINIIVKIKEEYYE